MWHDLIFLILGLGLLILGGNCVTDGGSSIARRFHMSGLLVGLTIVALGSSTPDLVVGVVSTLKGKTELAMGEIVGAAIFDFFLVVGIIALIKPIKVQPSTLSGDFPLAVAACWILFFLADDVLIDGEKANVLTRSDGLVMILVLAAFIAYTIRSTRCQLAHPQNVEPPVTTQAMKNAVQKVQADAVKKPKEMPLWQAALFVAGGLAALVFGGQWFVDGASGIAKHFGMSEALVGLTLVAIGSSLPDLATSVIAALKNEPGIALGNIIGGSIYNVLLVLGTCSIIHPLSGGTISQFDFLTMVVAATLAWIFAITGRKGQHVVTRPEGAVLVLGYVAYMVFLVIRG